MKKQGKTNLKIIVIILLIIFTIGMLPKNSYANAGDFYLIQDASKKATNEANSMSVEQLAKKIKQLEAEIQLKQRDEDYDTKIEEQIDKAKLNAYKNVYEQKTSPETAAKNATEEANSMSAEELNKEIKKLEAQIQLKQRDEEYENEKEEQVDKAKLNAYKEVYKKKTGTEYSGGSGSIGTQTGTITDPILNPSTYDPTKTNVETGKLSEIVRILVSIMTTLGIGIGLISFMIIGIRFMVASLEERAKYKETMVPYIVGITMVITISTIMKIMSALFFNIGP